MYGRWFLAAGAMMSLLAVPAVYAATRDGLQAVPGHMREAAFALGKTRITTIRRVLLPSVRSNSHRRHAQRQPHHRLDGDRVILLGETLSIETQGSVPGLDLLRGTGSSLTTTSTKTRPPVKAAPPRKPTRPPSCC